MPFYKKSNGHYEENLRYIDIISLKKSLHSLHKSVKSQWCALVQRGTDLMITVISYSFYTYRTLACYRPVSPYANVDLYYRIQKTHHLAWRKHRHLNRVYNNLPFWDRNSRSRGQYWSFFYLLKTILQIVTVSVMELLTSNDLQT